MSEDANTLLEEIIVGRVEPSIYAFVTNTVPNYLKVGDTYRPVVVRMGEWKAYYPDLEKVFEDSAKVSDLVFFRDFSVHDFLEKQRRFLRLTKKDIASGVYYSKEFFKGARSEDVDAAIADIREDYKHGGARYQYYSAVDSLPTTGKYPSTGPWTPRPNQRETVDQFLRAVSKGRRNLLMYAAMRFGKSFTAMCCAQKMNGGKGAKLVVIVSAKADVREEWRRTVESAENFRNDYEFIDADTLHHNHRLVTSVLKEGKRAVVFLTLQDLQTSTVKAHHADLFSKSVDLLLVDETHFGARSERYGEVLRATSRLVRDRPTVADGEDRVDGVGGFVPAELESFKKAFNVNVTIHLSGTPYRILMGDEFSKDDVIAFCPFSSIVDEQKKWDEENLQRDDVHEWDNPYYGFPQMVRFAFLPSQLARHALSTLKEQGVTYAMSALFEPQSIVPDRRKGHTLFKHESEVLDLFRVIDGSKSDENVLGFLDYDRIKQGKMCRHIVCVLPYCASCDALEALLQKNAALFKNLNEYQVLNISGHEMNRAYSSVESVRKTIRDAETADRKTLTLTVNRMLTGSTVPEWDTMIYFKDTASPQEYDQAIFRLQNQYVQEMTGCAKDGQRDVIKFNKKPQTLLVDFSPDRMFRMQELRSQFYNANADKKGNGQLENRIARELAYSPIITVNHGKLARVEPSDIMAVVREYSRSRGISEECMDIPYDSGLLADDALRESIEALDEIDAVHGLTIEPNVGDDDADYQIPSDEASPVGGDRNGGECNPTDLDEEKILAKKFAAYYARILLFAFLTEDKVSNLCDVIKSIAEGDSANRRIAKSLGLKVPILCTIQQRGNSFLVSRLDYKIQNINQLLHDDELPPVERARVAMRKFQRISRWEVAMPVLFADELIHMIPDDAIRSDAKVLVLSSVQGVLAHRLQELRPEVRGSNIYSVPSSPLAYELTCKVYRLLGLPVDHVFKCPVSSLVDGAHEKHVADLVDQRFDIVLGVPVFGSDAKGGRGDGNTSEYHRYFNFARDVLKARIIGMEFQAKWYTADDNSAIREFRHYLLTSERGQRHVRELHDYPDVTEHVEMATTLRGGICLLTWDRMYDGDCRVANHFGGHVDTKTRPLSFNKLGREPDCFIRWNGGLSILQKVLAVDAKSIIDDGLMSKRNPFGFSDRCPPRIATRKGTVSSVKVYRDNGRIGYVKLCDFTKNKGSGGLLSKWKVLVAKASSGGDEIPRRVISSPIVSEPGSVTMQTHLVISGVSGKEEAENLAEYMKTRFFRFMVNLRRINQNMVDQTFSFAPRLDFSRRWTDRDLYVRYGLTMSEQRYIESIIQPF